MREIQQATLIFMGGGPLRAALEAQVREHGLHKSVRVIDPVPPAQLLSVTADADLGITMLEDTCLNHRHALPNKLFEYLMARVPVLASDLPEVRGVVQTFDVGLVVPPERRAIARALKRCIEDTDQRSRWRANTHKVFEKYNWTIAARRFDFAYRNLFAS